VTASSPLASEAQAQQFTYFSAVRLCDLTCRGELRYRSQAGFLHASRAGDGPFEKKRFLPPIELMIVLALNAVVAILGYYAIMMWGFVRG
jgi:hypothetical protein